MLLTISSGGDEVVAVPVLDGGGGEFTDGDFLFDMEPFPGPAAAVDVSVRFQ